MRVGYSARCFQMWRSEHRLEHKETLKASHQLHDTPAGQVDYVSVAQSSEYPLFFCATR